MGFVSGSRHLLTGVLRPLIFKVVNEVHVSVVTMLLFSRVFSLALCALIIMALYFFPHSLCYAHSAQILLPVMFLGLVC